MGVILKIGEWEVDAKSNELKRGDQSNRLSPLAMDILLHLASQPGEVIDTIQLIERNWAKNKGSDNSLYKVISELRRTLGDTDRNNRIIQSVAKRGYRLTLPVSSNQRSTSNVGQTEDYRTLLDQSLNEANQRLQNREYALAIRHFKVVIDLCQATKLNDPKLEAETHLLIGDCLLQEQGKDAAQTHFDRAREIALEHEDNVQHAKALLGMSGNLQPILNKATHDFKNQLQLVYLAVPKKEQQLRIRLRARVISYSQPVTIELRDEASAIVAEARRLDDKKVLIYALLAQHECFRSLNLVQEQVKVSEELLVLARDISDRDVVIIGFLRRISDLLVLGRRDEASDLRAEMETLRPRILFQDELNRLDANFSMMDGEFERAEQLAMAISFRESGFLLMQFLQLINLARYRNQSAQLLPVVESVADDYQDLPATHVYLSLLYADCKKFDASRVEYEKLEDGLSSLNRDISWHAMLAALSEVAFLTNDEKLAKDLLADLMPLRGYHLVFTTIGYFGSAEFYLALLSLVIGDKPQGILMLEESLQKHQDMKCVPMIERNTLLLESLR